MTFGTSLALFVGLLVALPVVAHLLRRGKTEEVEFPPAHLVPSAIVTSDKRSRIEDTALMGLRGLTILLLAILGATPFVQCSHLSVDREAGASVALALVIDDSQSMQAVAPGDLRSRFERAKAGALQLLDSAREGDAIAVVGAGASARLLLNATTDLQSARRVVAALEVSDRATDLNSAVALGRAALKELPHADKRVALFSDQHDEPITQGTPPLWIPLPELAKPVANCGVAEATHEGNEVTAVVGCTGEAAVNQRLQLRLDSPQGEVAQERVLEPKAGLQDVTFTKVSRELATSLAVRLVNGDAITSDDVAVVSPEVTGLVLGVVNDRANTTAVTGGAPLIEQALDALDPTLNVKPLFTVPASDEELRNYAALVIDDPRGFSPEVRAALESWVKRGGVLLGLLGPNAVSTELATSTEPFARPGIQWENDARAALDPSSLGLLGGNAASLTDLRQTGRVRLDAADLPHAVVRGKWQDGVPFLFERPIGAGVVLTVGLPSSFETSELAIRPGFLSLLDVVREYMVARSGPRRTPAGVPWIFPAGATVRVEGEAAAPLSIQRGPIAGVPTPAAEGSGAEASPQQQLTATRTGTYQLTVDGRSESRTVTLPPRELVQLPEVAEDGVVAAAEAATNNSVDASPYWALVVLALFAVELGYRLLRTRPRLGRVKAGA